MAKMSNLSLSDVFFQALNAPKLVFGEVPYVGGAYDAPSDPVVGCEGGHPLSHTLPVFCVSIWASTTIIRSLQTKCLAKPMAVHGSITYDIIGTIHAPAVFITASLYRYTRLVSNDHTACQFSCCC